MHRTMLMVLLGGIWLGMGITSATAPGAMVQDPAAPPPVDLGPYIGSDACESCHAPQHTAWADTKHARALARLGASDKEGGQCIRCHVTGTPEMIAEDGANPRLPNVQCEACHGPGRAHVEAAQAGNPASARTAPVVEETCTRCHNEQSPRYKTFIFIALKGMVHRTG